MRQTSRPWRVVSDDGDCNCGDNDDDDDDDDNDDDDDGDDDGSDNDDYDGDNDDGDNGDYDDLQDHVHLSETREAFVPDWGQELLNIRVRHKLTRYLFYLFSPLLPVVHICTINTA